MNLYPLLMTISVCSLSSCDKSVEQCTEQQPPGLVAKVRQNREGQELVKFIRAVDTILFIRYERLNDGQLHKHTVAAITDTNELHRLVGSFELKGLAECPGYPPPLSGIEFWKDDKFISFCCCTHPSMNLNGERGFNLPPGYGYFTVAVPGPLFAKIEDLRRQEKEGKSNAKPPLTSGSTRVTAEQDLGQVSPEPAPKGAAPSESSR